MSGTSFGGRRALPWLRAGGLLLVTIGVLVHLFDADTAWMLMVHANAPSALAVSFWSCVTVLGLGWCALICVLAADRVAGRLTALLVPAFLLGGVLTHGAKWLLAVPRPAGSDLLPQLHVIGSAFRGPVSMPSGHALTAAAMAALLCIALPEGRRRVPVILLLLVAACIAWSRVVVGAHWPSDVFAGAGVGLLAVALCLAGTRMATFRRPFERLASQVRSPSGQRWVAVAELGAAAGLLAERTGYPAGTPMVLGVVFLACASAFLRCRDADTREFSALPDTPAERT